MKYSHIVSYVASTLWAIEPAKLSEIVGVLAFRAAGHEFSAEEIQARIGAGPSAGGASKRGAVAVIPVRGTIANRGGGMDDSSGGTSCERIGAMIDQCADDPGIGTILYDFDTPGGTVPGVMELAAKMFALRGQKTQIAMVNGMAASAGYWLASQCDEIVSTPSGTSGSIGVYSAHQDLSKALENEGISVKVFSAGKYKVEGLPFGPLSEEAQAFRQSSVDDAYALFVKGVAQGRGVSQASVRDGYGEGRALSSKDALKAGLIDSIGTMDETISRLVGGGKAPAGMRAENHETLENSEFISEFAVAQRLRLL